MQQRRRLLLPWQLAFYDIQDTKAQVRRHAMTITLELSNHLDWASEIEMQLNDNVPPCVLFRVPHCKCKCKTMLHNGDFIEIDWTHPMLSKVADLITLWTYTSLPIRPNPLIPSPILVILMSCSFCKQIPGPIKFMSLQSEALKKRSFRRCSIGFQNWFQCSQNISILCHEVTRGSFSSMIPFNGNTRIHQRFDLKQLKLKCLIWRWENSTFSPRNIIFPIR